MTMVGYRIFILIVLIVAIYNFVRVGAQRTAQQGEELRKNKCAFGAHIILMIIWIVMEWLKAHYIWRVYSAT